MASFYKEGGNRPYRDAFTPGEFDAPYRGGREPDMPGYTNYVFRHNVSTGKGANSLIIARFWDEKANKSRGNVQKHSDWMKNEYKGENNRYWNPDSTQVFDVSREFFKRHLADLEGWKKATGSEEGSTWGAPQ